MAFGKAVGPEPLDLGKAAHREIIVIAVLAHAAQEQGAECTDAPVFLERRERAAQAVRLIGGEIRAHDGDLHRLFLKQRHAQRLAQHRAEFVRGEGHLLLSVAAADIGVDHVALNGAGPDDRDLDHQIIEIARAHPRQKVHLRA